MDVSDNQQAGDLLSNGSNVGADVHHSAKRLAVMINVPVQLSQFDFLVSHIPFPLFQCFCFLNNQTGGRFLNFLANLYPDHVAEHGPAFY
jgi:hypothetical protein